MAKHTPGPWTIEKHGRGENGGIAIDATDPVDGMDFEVCEVWGLHDDRVHCPISRANARLIAAAPELLEALWVITEHNALHLGENHSTVIQGREVIRKATQGA